MCHILYSICMHLLIFLCTSFCLYVWSFLREVPFLPSMWHCVWSQEEGGNLFMNEGPWWHLGVLVTGVWEQTSFWPSSSLSLHSKFCLSNRNRCYFHASCLLINKCSLEPACQRMIFVVQINTLIVYYCNRPCGPESFSWQQARCIRFVASYQPLTGLCVLQFFGSSKSSFYTWLH